MFRNAQTKDKCLGTNSCLLQLQTSQQEGTQMRGQNRITWGRGPRCEGGRELLGLNCSTQYKRIKCINVWNKCTHKCLEARLNKSYPWIRWPGDQTTLANLGCADQKSVSKCFYCRHKSAKTKPSVAGTAFLPISQKKKITLFTFLCL